MIQIDNTIVSFDVLEKYFLCDLKQCKGICCVEGASGAPLTEEEAKIVEDAYPEIEPYLPAKSKEEIALQGYSVIDQDGDLVTPIINGKECVYAYEDKVGVTKCGIEKAFLDGKISFRKPISCHLYPIRITEYEEFDAVNYERIEICKAARACGLAERLPVYRFLREPLIRKYGEEWYAKLEIAAEANIF
ncbi:MAG: DUF3109 family protein [Bacteroidota bacterium]|nr:DUF3109 family protein [Bacteroidota bacterium]